MAAADGTLRRPDLALRAVTGAVLAAVALLAVWLGGLAFAGLVAAGVLAMFAEWAVLHRLPRFVRLAGLVALGGLVLLRPLLTHGELLMSLAGFAGALGLFAGTQRRMWGVSAAGGLFYCGLPGLALLWLRDLRQGLAVTIFVLAVVWATDIAAYFTGRALGGPRLAPAISPAKTWAGTIGGMVAAMLVGAALSAAYLGNLRHLGTFASLAGALAVLAVLGDLYESWVKRRAGVKDSGTLLPGHGGVLDRVDGLVPAAVAGAGFFAWTGWAG